MTRPRYAAAVALVGVLTTVGGGTAWACHTTSPPSGCVYQGHYQRQCPTTTTSSSTTSTTVPWKPPPTTPPNSTPPPTITPPTTTVPPATTVPPITTVAPPTTSPSTTVPSVTTLPPATTVPRSSTNSPVTTTAPPDCVYQGHHQQVCPTAALADSPGTAADTQAAVPDAVAPDAPSADAVADGSGQLAFTGSNVGMWVCLAGILLILGVGLVVLPREIAKRRGR